MVLVATDADNTLWDTNAVYVAAQSDLLRQVEDLSDRQISNVDRIDFIRRVDEELAHLHGGNLRYSPVLLVSGLVHAVRGESPTDSALRAVRAEHHSERFVAIADEFAARITCDIPPLRSGVQHGLERLAAKSAALVLVSEGHRERCEGLLCHYGLRPFFRKVMYAPKDQELYRDIAASWGNGPRRFMVGDQLDRDIDYAHRVGFRTVYFPSGFSPRWQLRGGLAAPDFEIRSFDQVPGIVFDQ